MKAITVTQPYAALIEWRAKKIETRSWQTRYRGPLAIHAGKGLGPVGGKRGFIDLVWSQPFASVLFPGWRNANDDDTISAFDFGAIVAMCELVACWPTCGDGYQTVVSDGEWSFNNWHKVSDQELAFGDYTPGRWAWLLSNIVMLPEPIPAKGALSLWEWS